VSSVIFSDLHSHHHMAGDEETETYFYVAEVSRVRSMGSILDGLRPNCTIWRNGRNCLNALPANKHEGV
jgi:hypothetical protein